ncbi:tetratricopeptide repeat protein [Acidobacteriota bacterium]
MKRGLQNLSLIVCFCLILLSLSLMDSCSKYKDSIEYTGPYLGQEPPGIEPQLFLPGLISTNYIDHCIAFLNQGRVCVFSIWEKGTYSMYEKEGRWTQPKKVPWQNEQGATTDFTAAPDDRTVYFQSRRPTSANDENQENNIWTVEWTSGSWSEPVLLPEPANSKDYSEGYPSAAPDGTVYFFTRSRPDSRDGDIYRTRFIKGRAYLEVERFEDPINSEYYEVDPFVAPDGSYLLFGSDRPGGYGLMDLYISFYRDDGTWTHPFNAGPTLNPFCIPTRMSITPDGEYFFFPSHKYTTIPKGEDVKSAKVELWGDYDVYWISTDFINQIREQYENKKCAAEKIRREFLSSDLSQAGALLEELYNGEMNEYYFELSEFLVFCGELIAKNEFNQADEFYETLLSVFPEISRIMLGYSVACILNGRTAYGLDLMKIFWSQFPDRKSEDVFIITYQLRNKSKKEDELEVLQFFTVEFPDSGLAHYWLAEAHEHYGNVEEALKYCARALELKPAFEDAVAMQKRLESKLKLPMCP